MESSSTYSLYRSLSDVYIFLISNRNKQTARLPCAKSFAVSRLSGTRQRVHLPCAYKTAHGKDVGHGEDYICRVPTKKTHGNCDAHGKDPVFAVCRTSGTRQRCGTRYEMTWPFCLPCATLNTRQIKTFAVCI